MSNKDVAVVEKKSLVKGLVAGLIGGLIATAAKTLAERMFPPHSEPEPQRPGVAAYDLTPAARAAAGIHWGFGATVGAAYGALAEYYPAASSRDGVNFGMTLMALTHESGVQSLGVPTAPVDQTTREKTSEVASHIIFGLVAETTRRLVRKML